MRASGTLAVRLRSHAVARPVVALVLGLFAVAPASAYETDQYTLREVAISDSVDLLNRRMNDTLRAIAAEWQQGEKPGAFAREIWRRVGGFHWVDRLERWAIRNDEVEKLPHPKRGSVYGSLPFWATRVNFLFGVGKTIKANGALFGTDKLGHFLSQGWKYWRRYRRGYEEKGVVKLGRRNEAGLFGAPFTGVYSNADLVANYEGYLFYRSLFEDGVVGEKVRIVSFEGTRAVIQRDFDFRDHINDYWDEALNPNHFDWVLDGPMLKRLQRLCDVYAKNPEAYVSEQDDVLRERYAEVGMKPGLSHRMDNVCADSSESPKR